MYDQKSCNALQKPFYRPTEAALRWCNLAQHEAQILQSVGDDYLPRPGAFPQWPCLRVNAEKIYYAVLNRKLPYGRDGQTVEPGEQVARHRLTIQHSDLKAWMTENYPDQKPEFLFDEIERSTHKAINADSFRALQVDRDAFKARYDKLNDTHQALLEERNNIVGERNSLRAMVDKANSPDVRSETTYLNIIGGLLGLLLGKSPNGKEYSSFKSQAAIISALLAHHPSTPGITARTLEDKFPAAKRSLIST